MGHKVINFGSTTFVIGGLDITKGVIKRKIFIERTDSRTMLLDQENVFMNQFQDAYSTRKKWIASLFPRRLLMDLCFLVYSELMKSFVNKSVHTVIK